ncbi:hypothetical protein SOCE26_028430 [Sorangium cellulosum]|uniref:Uncharacterized protein n=1 Tax=Sorangium cellulosum TaxID=56 RepID=A0A2L0EQ48_SORCE|nr:hypothetical protein [Sorangium cellulosum]AUX41431.1 hypothetical protein SOCE26_028430 [Sorangium cellulosum]
MRSTGALSGAGGAVKPAGARRGPGWRRALLGTLALGALAAPAIASGCVAGFDPPSRVDALRVFAVVADKPYAHPGDEVTFRIHYQDGFGDEGDAARPVSVYWFGGCENPIGDDYYGCYEDFAALAEEFDGWEEGDPLPELNGVSPGFGDTYTIRIGEEILSSREPPASGPHYGSAFVFFVACTGTPGPVEDQGTGRAGTFPIGCFDSNGRRLSADSFVPGYTQVYAFADGRENKNPTIVDLALDGDSMPEDFGAIREVRRCPLSVEERREVGCSAPDPFTDCTAHRLEVFVDPEDVAEIDPDAKRQSLKESVWVNYYADQGDLDGGIKLVSDASTGYIEDHAVTWVPPAEPGIATITAVLRDVRGGSHVVQRLVRVTE